MPFPFYIARRYLFSKKKHNVINIISAISVGGVALATAAMLCVLSGFNGFRDLIESLFTNFDPQLEIVPAKGKYAEATDERLLRVRGMKGVEAASFCVEDHALILFRGHPTVITLKGVDADYERCTGIRNILYGEGSYRLEAANLDYGIPGFGLAQMMGGPDFGTIQICVPKRGERINLSNPIENINVGDLTASGLCFNVHQQKYDNTLMLTSLRLAQRLFELEGRITQMEVKLAPGTDEARMKANIQNTLGPDFQVRDRYEQQEETFNVMAIEKLFSFVFLAFIVLVASFNIIGCVSMLIIEKKNDAETLRSLGANSHDIVQIFLFESRLITAIGAIIGLLLGLVLCLAQQQWGLLRLGTTGSFIINAYPISIHVTDVLLIFVTVIAVGFLAVEYPVRALCRNKLGNFA